MKFGAGPGIAKFGGLGENMADSEGGVTTYQSDTAMTGVVAQGSP